MAKNIETKVLSAFSSETENHSLEPCTNLFAINTNQNAGGLIITSQLLIPENKLNEMESLFDYYLSGDTKNYSFMQVIS